MVPAAVIIIGNARGIRSHVGNMPILIKLLCDLHRPGYAVTEFSRSFLLQRRGSKWRGRSSLAGFDADVGDFVVGADAGF